MIDENIPVLYNSEIIGVSFDNPGIVVLGDTSNLNFSTTLAVFSNDPSCFVGDCYCCPDDNSGAPVVNIEWDESISAFVYSVSGNQVKDLYLNATYGPFIGGVEFVTDFYFDWPNLPLEQNGSGTAYTNSIPCRYEGIDVYSSTNYLVFAIYAQNKCGITTYYAYCYCPICNSHVTIDCFIKKVVIRNFCYTLGSPDLLYEDIQEYDLGDVPESYTVSYNNGCGTPFLGEYETECVLTKNSAVFEHYGYPGEIFEERESYFDYISNWAYYDSVKLTGASSLNKTIVAPLYIKDCDGISDYSINEVNIAYNSSKVYVGAGQLERIWIEYFLNNGVYEEFVRYKLIANVSYFIRGLVPGFDVFSYSFEAPIPFVFPLQYQTYNYSCNDISSIPSNHWRGFCGENRFGMVLQNNCPYLTNSLYGYRYCSPFNFCDEPMEYKTYAYFPKDLTENVGNIKFYYDNL